MPTIATVVQHLQHGHQKKIRFDSDKILYVKGNVRKIQNAFLHDHDSSESLKAAAVGATSAVHLPLEQITRFQVRSDRRTIDIGYKNDKGRKCTIEIDAPNLANKNAIVQAMGIILKSKGLVQSDKELSFFWLAWKPIAWALAALFFGGLLTMAEASGGIDPSKIDHGTGRSGRRAKGASIIISLVANLLGFRGCLLVTLALLGICLFVLIRKLSNRPTVTVFARQ